MKRLIGIVLILLAVGICGFFGWKYFFGESEQDILERRLQEVSRTLGKIGNEGFLVQLEHARAISKYFDDVCDVRLPKFNRVAKMSRSHIEQNVVTVRNWATDLEARVYDTEYYFEEGDPLRCKVLFTVMVHARFRTGESFQEGYDMEINWVKKDGEWLIEGIGFSGILHR